MTSSLSVLASFAIILIDLLGRAGLDKVLALAGGPAVVALWAQLQSVLDLVSGVATTGVVQGLTVTVAQAQNAREERSLLKIALKLGLSTALAAALLLALASPMLSAWLTQDKVEPALISLAALGGLLLVIAAAIWRYLPGLMEAGAGPQNQREHFRQLIKFVPVGLAIGVMSPVSMLVIRGLLSGMLNWDDVGFLQALWRSSEWVTSTAAGVLSLVFLPRMSAAWGTSRFRNELLRAGMFVLIPAASLLLFIYFNQRAILSTLYNARFAVSNETAALFLLGCWIRITAWIFLFGLFAAHRTRLIVAGEILSLPLIALLLWIFRDGMTLERTALIYVASYCVYLGFNATALLYSRHATLKPSRESS